MMGLNKLTQFDLTVPEKYHMFYFSFCVRVGYRPLMTFRHLEEGLLEVTDKKKNIV